MSAFSPYPNQVVKQQNSPLGYRAGDAIARTLHDEFAGSPTPYAYWYFRLEPSETQRQRLRARGTAAEEAELGLAAKVDSEGKVNTKIGPPGKRDLAEVRESTPARQAGFRCMPTIELATS